MKTKQPIWARTLIEAGKTAVFLASFFAIWTLGYGAVTFQPGALIVLAMLGFIGLSILIGYIRLYIDNRRRDHT